jgi:hypothetical protein
MLGHQQGTQRLAVQLLPIACSLTLTAPFTGRPVIFLAVTAGFVAVNWWSVWMHARGTFHPLHTEGSQLVTCFSNIAGLLSAFMPHERFRPTRKNARRDERSFVKLALWGIVAIAIAALIRDAHVFLGAGGPDEPLAIGCAFFISLNLLVLLDFLLPLHAYERREAHTNRRPDAGRRTLASPRRTAAAALVVPFLLAGGAAVAPAAISGERRLPAGVSTPQAADRLPPDLRRLLRPPADTTQTCRATGDALTTQPVVVGSPDLSCDRFPASAPGDGPELDPVLG